MTTTTTARVQVVVDIPAGSSWGGTCDLAQVEKQATVDVMSKLQRAISEIDSPLRGSRIVGVAKVIAITTDITPDRA